MARYDKYDPKDGGFRAPLDAAIADADAWTPFGVGLNANGRVVVGGGNTGVVGVLIAHGAKSAGDVVDVMTDGEIVEIDGGVAGSPYAAAADGTLAAGAAGGAPAAGTVAVGFTVEATRLVVRAGRTAVAAV